MQWVVYYMHLKFVIVSSEYNIVHVKVVVHQIFKHVCTYYKCEFNKRDGIYYEYIQTNSSK